MNDSDKSSDSIVLAAYARLVVNGNDVDADLFRTDATYHGIVTRLRQAARPHEHEWQPGPVVGGPFYNPATIAVVCKCGAVDKRNV